MFNAGLKKKKKKKVDNRRTPTALKEYQVKELMKKRELNSRIQYLVRWESYEDDKFDTWLYEEHISQSAINGYAEGKSFTKMRASIVAGRHPSDPAYQNHLRMAMWLKGTQSTKSRKRDEKGDGGREGTGGGDSGDRGEGGGDGSDGRGDEKGGSKKRAKCSEAKSTLATSRYDDDDTH